MFDSADYAALIPVRDSGIAEVTILLTYTMRARAPGRQPGSDAVRTLTPG